MHEESLKQILTNFYRRIKQEAIGANDEILDRVVRQHTARMARLSWKACQKWCKFKNDGPVLMPDGTRIYYRKGNTEVLLQEFPPQIRLLKFKGSLLRNSSLEKMPEADSAKIHHLSLALPYVIFVHCFKDGVFQKLWCSFSDRPLKKLEESPLRPYLPNIDSQLYVCLGRSFDSSKLQKHAIAQQVAFVMDQFWHSAFNDENAQHYWDLRHHFVEKGYDKLASLRAWETASVENPLFVIDEIEWLKWNGFDTFGDVIVSMCDDSTDHALQEAMYKDFVDNLLKEVKSSLITNLDAANQDVIDKQLAVMAKEFEGLIKQGS